MSTRGPRDRHTRRVARLIVAAAACTLLAAPGVARAANSDPTACISQSPAAPFSGDTVTFTSCSTDRDGSVAWQVWDLDNDGSWDDGFATAVSRVFATPGQYTVRLAVVDNKGDWDLAQRTVTIANRAPVAAFGFTPATPLSGEKVTFTSSSSDPDGSIATYSWDLDDDGAFDDGSGSTASRTFATPGDHTVKLRVVDDRGLAVMTSRTVSVTNRAPVAAFGFAPASPLSGETVTFTSSSSDPDGSVASQAWDLDDDGSFDDGSGASASRSFAKPGDYTVRLRALDDRGAATVTSHNVAVGNRGPIAAFGSVPATPLTGEALTFTSSSTDPDGSIATYGWDLDDDGDYDDGTASTASRAFATPGDHTVKLRVVDDRGSASTTSRTVTVRNRAPIAAFAHAPDSPLSAETVTFTSSASDPDGSIASQAWDLDDDGSFDDGTGSTASRSFATPGDHDVSLRVVDDRGAAATITRTVTVRNRAPRVAFDQSPASPLSAEEVTFTSTSSDQDGSISSLHWDLDNDGDFDDGSGGTASRSFAKPGTYTVRLWVADDRGAAAIAKQTVTVRNRAPRADFDRSPDSPLSGEAVTFTSTASDADGSIAGLHWDLDNDGDFDDGSAATASTSFAKPGTYTVRLWVADDQGAPAIASRTFTVRNRAPNAAFDHAPDSPLSAQTVTFTSSASDPDGSIAGQTWDLDDDGAFDDGTGSSATGSFATPGDHTVWLRVVDDSGAVTVASGTVSVGNRAPVAAFSFGPQSPLTADEVTFTSSSSDPDGSIATYGWDLDDDGAFDDADGSTAKQAFATAGDHTVRLRVVDDRGSAATTALTVHVSARPAPPPPPGEPFDDSTPVDGNIPGNPPQIQPLRFLDPFPVVRIKGRATRQGARITLFTVSGPPGARVKLQCKGRSCPLSTAKGTIRSTRGRQGTVRFRRIERSLRAGVVLTVFVTDDGVVGKYTRIVIRKLVAPRRKDSCLMPGSLRPRPCPRR